MTQAKTIPAGESGKGVALSSSGEGLAVFAWEPARQVLIAGVGPDCSNIAPLALPGTGDQPRPHLAGALPLPGAAELAWGTPARALPLRRISPALPQGSAGKA